MCSLNWLLYAEGLGLLLPVGSGVIVCYFEVGERVEGICQGVADTEHFGGCQEVDGVVIFEFVGLVFYIAYSGEAVGHAFRYFGQYFAVKIRFGHIPVAAGAMSYEVQLICGCGDGSAIECNNTVEGFGVVDFDLFHVVGC